MGKLVTITRKIELRFNSENKEEITGYWKDLYKWRDILQRGANLAISHMFTMANEEQLVYLTERGKDIVTNIERKKQEIYKVVNAEMKEMYNTSPQNAFYRLLSHNFKGQVPMAMITALNSVLSQTFNANKIDYLTGKKSLASFRNTLPVPAPASQFRNLRRDTILIQMKPKKKEEGVDMNKYEEKEYPSIAFTLYNIPFHARFGQDYSGNRKIFERGISRDLLPEWIIDKEEYFADLIKGTKENDFQVTVQYNDHDHVISFRYIERDHPEEKGQKLYHYLVSVAFNDRKVTSFKMVEVGDDPDTEEEIEALAEAKAKVEAFLKLVESMAPTNLAVPADVAAAKKLVDKKAKKKPKKPKRWAIVSDYKFCDSSIVIEKQKKQNFNGTIREVTKIFLLAVFQFDKDKFELDEKKTAMCELGVDIPITVTFGDRKPFPIGDKAGYLHRRIAIQGGVYRAQKVEASNVKSGHGRKRKLITLDRYKKAEYDYINTTAHKYAKELVQFCLRNQIKFIVLGNAADAAKRAGEDKLLLRNWGVGGMIQKIKDKANRVGIEVIDPRDDEEETPQVI